MGQDPKPDISPHKMGGSAPSAGSDDAIPMVAFVSVILGPKGRHKVAQLSRATGMTHDEVAAHLLERLRAAQTQAAGFGEPLAPQARAKKAPIKRSPRPLEVPIPPETNLRLLADSRLSCLTKGEVAAYWLEEANPGLGVFVQTCRAQRAMHRQRLINLNADLEEAIREGQLLRVDQRNLPKSGLPTTPPVPGALNPAAP